ncbi:hypothetical protein HHX47_DHR3001138 [Lentinula edodes]|nr:hypothetical protein HHX47_DHR3001138 [Lentinula edodes]
MSVKRGITLYSAPTPNGFKVAVFLEELKSVYDFDYEVRPVNVAKGEQKDPWFIAINPNGRIPAIVDHSRNDFVVFETAAILIYLQQHYDTENKFGWDPKENPDKYSEMLQWIFFARWCENTLSRDAWEVAGNVGRVGDTTSLYRVG